VSVCVHGLGYVGLSAAALFATNDHDVTGFDTDDELVDCLRRGESTLGEPALDEFVERALDGRLSADHRPVAADVHLVCVPTPLDEERETAALGYVESAARTIADLLRPGDTVVLESTVPPGTTEGLFRRCLEESGLRVGESVHLGFSPETIMPGNTVAELRANDRIVGGFDDASTQVVADLYRGVTEGDVLEAPDPTTAEFVKVAQNASRDAEVAFANTLAMIADEHGVDVRDAIVLANEHPRVDILDPGPGVGGHCIPVDPYFLTAGSSDAGVVPTVREVNDAMPGYVVEKVRDAVESVPDPTFAVLGAAYKGNVSDARNSPGLEIARQLGELIERPRSMADGGDPERAVRIHDPHVTDPTLDIAELEEAVDGAHAVVVVAAHDEFRHVDPEVVGSRVANRVVVDAVDVLNAAAWERRGFDVVSI
jgi:UDP-N-acetyl-D-mannosaminuronic acid dehydrogenase